MPVAQNELYNILTASFPEAIIKLNDLAGDEDHYSLEITSAVFNGLSLIEQHKMVKAALKDILGTKLHALTITTRTP